MEVLSGIPITPVLPLSPHPEKAWVISKEVKVILHFDHKLTQSRVTRG